LIYKFYKLFKKKYEEIKENGDILYLADEIISSSKILKAIEEKKKRIF